MQQHQQSNSTMFDPPPTIDAISEPCADDFRRSIMGVTVTDVTRPRAIELLSEMIRRRDGRTHTVFFVNAHTLNLAAVDPEYRRVLNSADHVFGDGTGVRWATRLQGARMRGNVNGTDLTPELFAATAGRGYRYFLLGADEATIHRAAKHAEKTFTGWTQAGFHHGYLTDPEASAEVIRQINEARPDVLLVGMGNPIQERWIREHRHELKVPVCIATGGLFTYWAGDLNRAPRWLRRIGWEWLGILLQQPSKARRYLLGNPLFLGRALKDAWKTRLHRRLRNVYLGNTSRCQRHSHDSRRHGLSH